MRVLVTGGLGVNGSWVTRQLVERGLSVVVLDIRPDFSLLGQACRDRISFIQGDIRDAEAVAGIIRRHDIEAVVHLAAAVGHGSVDPDPKLSFDLNAGASATLLEESRKAGVRRFVFASSRAVYGDLTGEFGHPVYRPVPETHPLLPTKMYDLMKVVSEGLGKSFSEAFEIEFVALRFATIFGPGKTVRHKSFSLLSRIVEEPVQGRAVVIDRGGDQRDDIIFAEDAARGVVAALVADRLQFSEYNISTGASFTLHDLADAVRSRVPDADITIGPGLNFFGVGPNYSGVLDPTRARDDLGFSIPPDLDFAVERYMAALHEFAVMNSTPPMT